MFDLTPEESHLRKVSGETEERANIVETALLLALNHVRNLGRAQFTQREVFQGITYFVGDFLLQAKGTMRTSGWEQARKQWLADTLKVFEDTKHLETSRPTKKGID